MKFVTITALSLLSIASFGQINITPYISAGYANHLSRNGLNLEAGIESEFFKRADFTLNYRYMNTERAIKVSAVSANISYVIINRNNQRLLLGPGLSYGKYIRDTGTPGYDKNYTSTWFDWGKIRYDYTLKNKYRLGIVASLSGEDGDGSTFIGLIIGYKL
jgi:hypothetical protein